MLQNEIFRIIRRTVRKSGPGMAAVEAALAIPILLVLVLSLVETGNMAHAWLTVHKAAQTGARFAATGQGEDDGSRMALIELQVDKSMERLRGGASGINVSSWAGIPATGAGAPGAGNPCGMVEVEVVYDYHSITPLAGTVFPAIIPLAGADRKMVEPYKPCD